MFLARSHVSYLTEPWRDGTHRLRFAVLLSLLPHPERSHRAHNLTNWWILGKHLCDKTIYFRNILQQGPNSDSVNQRQTLHRLSGTRERGSEAEQEHRRVKIAGDSGKTPSCCCSAQRSVLRSVPCMRDPTLLGGQWKRTWLPRPGISAHHFLSWFLRPDRPRCGLALCPRSLTARQSVFWTRPASKLNSNSGHTDDGR